VVKYEDLKTLAEIRLKEAKVLYRNKLYDGSAYLCGYVVELSLKALICKHLCIPNYIDEGDHKLVFKTHEFDRLLILAGLSQEINIANSVNIKLYNNWLTLTPLKPEIRYSPPGTYRKEDVLAMLKALSVKKWGFFSWIKNVW
jgi:HEPN domain-containing protein